jgi:hypothetical protein
MHLRKILFRMQLIEHRFFQPGDFRDFRAESNPESRFDFRPARSQQPGA